MKFKTTDKILMVGRSGCGKSYLGNQIAKIFPRLIIFDSLDEHQANEHDYVVHSYDEFANLIKMLDNDKKSKFKIIVKMDTSIEDIHEVADHYFKLIYHFGDCIVNIEEVQDYCSPYFIGRYLKKCMTSGRHHNIGFIFTTQRPSFLNKTIMSQCTHIFVGNLIDKNDVRSVSTFINSEKNEIAGLPNFQFLWFTPHRTPHTIKIKSKK